jgi:hypothetical protein
MKIYLLFYVFMMYQMQVLAFGQSEHVFANLMARANITLLSNDPATAHYQPARTSKGLCLNYYRPFGIRELDSFQFASGFTLFGQSFSASAFMLNNEYIRDNVFHLGYSKSYANISVGTNISYYVQGIIGYDTLQAFTLSIGTVWNTRQLVHGFSFSNLTHTEIKTISLPSVFKYELKVAPLENTDFAVSFQKEIDYRERLAFAVSQNILDIITISTGFINNPGQFTAGFDVSVGHIGLSYGVRTHTTLGLTTALGIKYLLP